METCVTESLEIMNELYPDDVAYVFTKEITDKQEIKDFCRAYWPHWFIDERIEVVYDDGDELWMEDTIQFWDTLGDYEEFKKMVENGVRIDLVRPAALYEFYPIFTSAHRDTWYLGVGRPKLLLSKRRTDEFH